MLKLLQRHSIIIMAIFVLLLTAESCKKKEDDDVPSAKKTTAKYYFNATIDGVAYSVEDLKDGYTNGVSTESDMLQIGTSNDFNYFLYDNSIYLDYNKLEKGYFYFGLINKFFNNSNPPPADRIAKFTTGVHNYGIFENSQAYEEGAAVTYLDAQGKNWATYFGSADQTGSTFNITEAIDNTDGTSYMIIKATFNCTLYDKSGNSMKLTNGEGRGRIIF